MGHQYDERLLTIMQVARLIGVTPNTLHRWMRAGKIPRPSKIDKTTGDGHAYRVKVFTRREFDLICEYHRVHYWPNGPLSIRHVVPIARARQK